MGLPDRQEEAEGTVEQKHVMQHDLLYLTSRPAVGGLMMRAVDVNLT